MIKETDDGHFEEMRSLEQGKRPKYFWTSAKQPADDC